MSIVFTLHALERLRQRGINKELVHLCIQNPDKEERNGEIHKCIKRVDNMVIIAIYRKENDNAMVITAYLSSKLHKYLEID